jgi:hypothetical protein
MPRMFSSQKAGRDTWRKNNKLLGKKLRNFCQQEEGSLFIMYSTALRAESLNNKNTDDLNYFSDSYLIMYSISLIATVANRK